MSSIPNTSEGTYFVDSIRTNICNEAILTIKNTIYELYDWGKSGNPARLLIHLEKLLIFMHALFKKYNIIYIIECGTLLGAIRHNSLIPWDYDLDVVVEPNSFNIFKELYKTQIDFPENGDYTLDFNEQEKLYRIYNKHEKDWVWVDILKWNDMGDFIQNDVPEEYLNPQDRENYEPLYPKKFIFPLKTITMYNLEFPIPNNPDAILTILYGDYWSLKRVPALFYFLYQPVKGYNFISNYWINYEKRKKEIEELKKNK